VGAVDAALAVLDSSKESLRKTDESGVKPPHSKNETLDGVIFRIA
jgi:hypothetical protein